MPVSLYRSQNPYMESTGVERGYDLFAIGEDEDRYLFLGHEGDSFMTQTEQPFEDEHHRERLLDILVPIVDTD